MKIMDIIKLLPNLVLLIQDTQLQHTYLIITQHVMHNNRLV